MNAQFYRIEEQGNVLFARAMSPQAAARLSDKGIVVVLAESRDLQDLAKRRKKLLYVTNPPPSERLAQGWRSPAQTALRVQEEYA